MARSEAQTRDRYASAGMVDVRREMLSRRASAIEAYRLDPLLPLREGRIRVWDPTTRGAVVWTPWENQVASILAWIDVAALAEGRLFLRNLHVEKSRQMGETTAFAYAALWIMTYWPSPLFVQHADLDRVSDPGLTYNSFFGKMRFLHDLWPTEIGRAPLRFTGGNRPSVQHTSDRGAFVIGAGQSADAARTGRYVGAIIDEAARIFHDQAVQAALSSAVPDGQVMLSTPNGEGNVYFDLRETRPHGWTFLRHHWTEHPLYSRGLHVAGAEPGMCVRCAATLSGAPYDPRDPEGPHRYPGRPTSPWYDAAVLELTDEQVAQELDIDYAGSLTARVYPEFDSDVHVAERDIPWDPYLRIETAWDYGLSTSVVICQEGPLEQRVIGEVEMQGTPEAIAAAVDAELRALGVSERDFAVRDTWLNVGDPAGDSRQIPTLATLTSQYAMSGYSIISQPTRSVRRTIDSVKRLLGGQPKPVVVSPRCVGFIRHAKANRWPTDARGNPKPSPTEPVNDEHNHIMRGFAYLVHWKWPAPEAEDSIREAARAAAREASGEDDSGRLDPGIEYGMKF